MDSEKAEEPDNLRVCVCVCVCYLFLIEGRLLYNIGLISSIQQHELAMLCLTLCDPLDCSLPGSSVHGILQARILEWVAMPSFRGSSQSRDRTHTEERILRQRRGFADGRLADKLKDLRVEG